MKNFFKLLICATMMLAFSVINEADAQFNNFTQNKTSTSSGADTVTGNIIYPFSTVGSLTVTVTKASGTLAGTIYVYGSNIGNTYTLLDSATVTNTTGAKDYDFNGVTNAKFTLPYFYRYRFQYIQTGGAASAVRGYVLTRSGR